MKNKPPKDPFDTYCWSYAVITDPYQVFAECFMFADIGAFRKTIRQVLLSAAEDKVYKKEQPASALDLFKAITSVILAAQVLCRQKKTSGLKIEQQQFTDKRLYARPGACCAEWEYLPKNLSAKEYGDPYKVFHRFFKYQDVAQWRQSINQALGYALAGNAEGCSIHLLKLYVHLTKLMEAAHLIDVREVLHVDGVLKPA
ncbi:hypothetical protein [Niabella aurantiaca]|uniref:hypothetical protein n=1 Tax=Niabella aurantiaca TaxID=379900 RepID=UPI0003674C7A|nr:hypothetical protein [Niabella aurantiaca]